MHHDLAPKQVSQRSAIAIVIVTIAVAGSVGAYRFAEMRRTAPGLDVASAADPIHVPLWVPRDQVRHKTRFACLWDGPAPLAPLRQSERLDVVVRGASSPEARARKLMHWARAQFEPSRPDPYPPPDAMTTLAEIRSGRTGGFCAQYAFILVQALQSFGMPARVVTIEDHEVVEAWLDDEGRWTMLDPLFDLQVVDERGRSLSAIEIRRARQSGTPMSVTPGDRLEEPLRRYVARYDEIALWIRNAFVSAPVNFSDFDRYRVWLVSGDERPPTNESLATTHHEGLYARPADFPQDGVASGTTLGATRAVTSTLAPGDGTIRQR